MAELLDRARLLVAAGPYNAQSAEVAAVHDTIWPEKAPVCPTLTCRKVLGVAYFAIKRWVDQQDASSTLSNSSTVKKSPVTARFHSDQLVYTPHGLGVAYTNVNLTDKAARDILKADPDAAQHFAVLPPAAEEGEDEPLTPAQASAQKLVEKAQHPTPAPAAGLDYARLAAALLDEQDRRSQVAPTQPAAPAPVPVSVPIEQPALTASVGGASESAPATEVKTDLLPNGVEVKTGEPADFDNTDVPVRLSRMNKEQLVAAYRTELNLEPIEGLTNDQLRDAIAEHREANATAQ